MTKDLQNDTIKHRKKRAPEFRIGSPRLPFFVESFLSCLLVVPCLTVSGYYWVRLFFFVPRIAATKRCLRYLLHLNRRKDTNQCEDDTKESNGKIAVYTLLENWLPLTTTSYNEVHRASALERHDQLVKLLRHLGIDHDEEEKLIRCVRSNEICRRLATLTMTPYYREPITNSNLWNRRRITSLGLERPDLALPQKLAICWPKLLTLPLPPCNKNGVGFVPKISLIVPAYGEKGLDVASKLEWARSNCVNPERVEVIVVDAGKCEDLSEETCLFKGKGVRSWGKMMVLKFTSGGGRGPCLNFGGNAASGEILTFCHSDTILPNKWDASIISSLQCPGSEVGSIVRNPNSCAFPFGIDTFTNSDLSAKDYPPGLKVIEKIANLRTRMFSLPYGDQALSIPAHVFQHVGGFPDQCLFEDYELVSLLRKRVALLGVFAPCEIREELVIIDGEPALTGPRRWQKLGVPYVTVMNQKLILSYEGGSSPNCLYERYYGGVTPKRDSDMAPWEHDFAKMFA